MLEVLGGLAGKVSDFSSPLLEERTGNRTLIVLMTSDKGLCGGFNANLIRAVQQYLRENPDQTIEMVTVGRKGRDFFKRRGATIVKEYVNITAKTVQYQDAAAIARDLIGMFEGESDNEESLTIRPDRVFLVYAEFKSAISQIVKFDQLLPVVRFDNAAKDDTAATADYIFEQAPAEIFDRLLPRFVETQIFQALLESVASEHGARMAAMDSASRNAGDVINKLTLNMNRIRQAAITNEIIEVVSGASAL
jgi:F-type H+-transporting ATPase subunit gamma